MTTTKRSTSRAPRSPRDPMMVPLAHVAHDERAWNDGDRDQLTFGDIPPSDFRPSALPTPTVATTRTRERAHRDALSTAKRVAQSENPARDAALSRLNEDIFYFIRSLGVGARFQSPDVHNWLKREGKMPDKQLVDPRALGGIMLNYVSAGVLRVTGSRVAAPIDHHASERKVYEITRLHIQPITGQEAAACG